jgi:hypothetical protein
MHWHSSAVSIAAAVCTPTAAGIAAVSAETDSTTAQWIFTTPSAWVRRSSRGREALCPLRSSTGEATSCGSSMRSWGILSWQPQQQAKHRVRCRVISCAHSICDSKQMLAVAAAALPGRQAGRQQGYHVPSSPASQVRCVYASPPGALCCAVLCCAALFAAVCLQRTSAAARTGSTSPRWCTASCAM